MALIDFKELERQKKLIKESQGIVDITGLTKEKKPKVKKRNLQQLVKETNREVDTKDIVQALFIKFANHRYILNNAYIFDGWESDFITVTESMYVYEIESKMTKSDFRDDFNKKEKHILLESKEDKSNLLKPNKFYYCAPRGMLATYEVPSYAGFMEVARTANGLECITVREAPFLHKEDVFSSIKDSMLQKLSWRYRDIMLQDYENAIKISTKEEIL